MAWLKKRKLIIIAYIIYISVCLQYFTHPWYWAATLPLLSAWQGWLIYIVGLTTLFILQWELIYHFVLIINDFLTGGQDEATSK